MYSRFPLRLHWRSAAALLAASTAACDMPMSATSVTPTDVRALATPVSPPVSLEWQAVARAQVATNNMSALAAARLYAAVSVAQARGSKALAMDTAREDALSTKHGAVRSPARR